MKTRLYIADTECLENSELFSRLFDTVPKNRREKINGKGLENDKRLSLAAGLLLKHALEENGAQLSEDTAALGEKGKPYFEGATDLHFNLSHSGRKALCIISEREVGCDVEKIRAYNPRLAAYVCSKKQLAALEALPENERDEAFIKLWTMKESYMKAIGYGIGIRASTIEFPIDGCSVYSYKAVDGHCISCCIRGADADMPEIEEIFLDRL